MSDGELLVVANIDCSRLESVCGFFWHFLKQIALLFAVEEFLLDGVIVLVVG